LPVTSSVTPFVADDPEGRPYGVLGGVAVFVFDANPNLFFIIFCFLLLSCIIVLGCFIFLLALPGLWWESFLS
jgi:hypothetical protein